MTRYKYVRSFSQYYLNVVSGNYINFAICEYYNDDTFTQLTVLMVKMVTQLDLNAVRQYSKVYASVFTMLQALFMNH